MIPTKTMGAAPQTSTNKRSTPAPLPMGRFPADYRAYAVTFQKSLKKVRHRFTEWEWLEKQKELRFLTSDNLAGRWVELEREGVALKMQPVSKQLTFKKQFNSLKSRQQRFLIENDIRNVMPREVYHAGRRFALFYPEYAGPRLKTELYDPICQVCGVVTGQSRLAFGDGFCPHCQGKHPMWRSIGMFLQLHEDMTKRNFVEMWPTIQRFLARHRSTSPQKRLAPHWERNQQWLRNFVLGKTLNEIVRAELRSKRRAHWMKVYGSAAASHLKKLIRETIRNLTKGRNKKNPSSPTV